MIACEPSLRLCERRKWDFCVDAAGPFFCSRGLFTQNDRLPMRPRLVFNSDLYPEENRGYIASVRVVEYRREDRNTGDVIRSNRTSRSCAWTIARVSSHVNGRVRSNERSNERSVSNGWITTLDRLRNR